MGQKKPTLIGIWVRTISEEHRLRLPEDIWEKIPWLKGADVECIGSVGAHGQLQILPKLLHADTVQKVGEALRQQPVRSEEASAPWLDFVRQVAAQWELKFQLEAGRRRMTILLPKEARDVGVAPSADMVAVVLSMGEVVEVWKAETWVDYCRKTRPRLGQLGSEVLDQLSDRD